MTLGALTGAILERSMRKETPRGQCEGSNESDVALPRPGNARSSEEDAQRKAGEDATASDNRRTIEDLLRLVDELQRKSADHDGKLGELSQLLTRKP